MSAVPAFAELKLHLIRWCNETTSPAAGVGQPGEVGSFWQRNGVGPADPTELYLKTDATDDGWVHQNLVNLNVFNVLFYGAVGDGVTNDRPAIQLAVNAAVAAGGGIVYFPATPNFYSIVRPPGPSASLSDLILVQNGTNIVFMGDGYASKVRQTGDCAGFESYMFVVLNGSSHIRFYNFYIDNYLITNPDVIQQNHGIQVQGRAAPAAGGPFDVEITEMFFGGFVGDGSRLIAEVGKEIEDGRTRLCTYIERNAAWPQGGRTCYSVQRYTRKQVCEYNFMTGSHDQQIDFEPTGIASGQGGPSDYIIVGNMFDHESGDVDCVTLGGSGGDPIRWGVHQQFSYNIIIDGGDIQAINTSVLHLRGNIVQFNPPTSTLYPILLKETCDYAVIDSNIAINENAGQPRLAIQYTSQAGLSGHRCVISNNICQTMYTVASGVVIGINSVSGYNVIGNLCTMNSTQTGAIGIAGTHGSGSVVSQADNGVITGNLVVNIGAASMLAHSSFGVDNATVNNNTMANYNLGNGTFTNGVRWNATSGTFPGGVSAFGNHFPGATSQSLSVGTTLPVGADGNGAPSVGIRYTNNPAGPEAVVTAPIGSLATNNGASTRVLSFKESGAGSTGWTLYGGAQVTMGAQASSTATAARFLAPGQGLAVESATEIEWVVPRPGRVRNLQMRCTAGVGAGNVTYTVRRNAADTAMTFTITNVSASGSSSGAQTTSAGDRISCRITKTSAPGTPQSNIVTTVEVL